MAAPVTSKPASRSAAWGAEMTALALLQSAPSAPANDNTGVRYNGPDTEGDRWVWLIEKFKTINTGLAVFAAQERLRGVKVEDFCANFIRAAKADGWECFKPAGFHAERV